MRSCVPGHPVSDQAINEDFPRFVEEIRKRLWVGADSYGDGSFSKDPVELLNEIENELLDVAGWGFITFCRIRELKKKLEAVKNTLDKFTNL